MTPNTCWWWWLMLVVPLGAAERTGPEVFAGAARIDITPELPIRLSGYQSRPAEATRAETPLTARALAIGRGTEPPVVLITVELIGVGEETSAAVAEALHERHGIERSRLAIAAIHTHTGPALADVLPFMFSRDLPADEVARIERYTLALRRKLVEVAEAALAARRPARLAWGEGRTDFAVQRRSVVDGQWKAFGAVPGGPVDHALPVLRVNDAPGALRAVFTSYACHCTTLGGADNYVHHEWAGDAARRLEAAHPGAVALVALGCGADANPNRRSPAGVTENGAKVAAEVERLLAADLRPIGAVTAAAFRRVELEFERVISREELVARSKQPRAQVAYAAAKFLARLDAGRSLPAAVSLPVQAWDFGGELAMVFLGGEVVSEYSLRLRRELDAGRLWVNAYANDVPCYVAAERMFTEGGYEVDGSMDYYGWPTRFARGTEDRVIAAVRGLLPRSYLAKGTP